MGWQRWLCDCAGGLHQANSAFSLQWLLAQVELAGAMLPRWA